MPDDRAKVTLGQFRLNQPRFVAIFIKVIGLDMSSIRPPNLCAAIMRG
jgi:hypothetical protein